MCKVVEVLVHVSYTAWELSEHIYVSAVLTGAPEPDIVLVQTEHAQKEVSIYVRAFLETWRASPSIISLLNLLLWLSMLCRYGCLYFYSYFPSFIIPSFPFFPFL